MAIASNLAIRRAARLASRGEKKKAADILARAIEKGLRDPRLYLRRALLTGSREDIAAESSGRAGWFFLALMAYEKGDLAAAEKEAERASRIAPGNLSARALLALVSLRKGDAGPLVSMKKDLAAASLAVQALVLAGVEAAIAEKDPEDMGAAEREEKLEGPAGWALGRIDDLAVLASWALSHALNLVINITDPGRRAVYRYVTEGDRLAGFGRLDDAAARFVKALSLDPENPEALELLAEYYLRKNETAKAEDCQNRLEKLAGDEAGAEGALSKRRGEILFRKGRLAEARRAFSTAGRSLWLDYMPPYREGLCALRSGDVAGAVSAFREALGRINPRLLEERVERLGELVSRR